MKEYHKEYNKQNPDVVKKSQKKYRENNKEKCRERCLNWKKNNPDYDKYLEMDKAGITHTVTAREDGKIIGYHVSFIMPHLHYKQSKTCFTDIYFISKEHRKGFVGFIWILLVTIPKESSQADSQAKLPKG